jgi:hypothetical protein
MRETFRNVPFRRAPARPPAHGLSADLAAIDVNHRCADHSVRGHRCMNWSGPQAVWDGWQSKLSCFRGSCHRPAASGERRTLAQLSAFDFTVPVAIGAIIGRGAAAAATPFAAAGGCFSRVDVRPG